MTIRGRLFLAAFVLLVLPGIVFAAWVSTTLDSTGNVGHYSSIAIGNDGFPIASYRDVTNQDLKVIRCGNAACSSGNTITTVDSTGIVGWFTALTIGDDGLPVISYYDFTNTNLKVVHCGNAACSSGNTITTVDSTGDVGYYTSIAIGDYGLPVISYWDSTNTDLKTVHCGDAACSSGNTITTVDNDGIVGTFTSITIGNDGRPVISYHDFTNTNLKVLHCGNAACSSGNTITTVDSDGDVGEYTSIAIGDDGLPVISYRDGTNADVKVIDCGNAACSSGNTITTVDSDGDVGLYTWLAIGDDGLQVISYYDNTNGDIKVAVLAPAAVSASSDSGGGGMAWWLIQLRQRNGLNVQGQPLSSSSSSSSFSSSIPSSTSSVPGSDSTSTSPSSSSSSSQSSRFATPTKMPPQLVRVCQRAKKRLTVGSLVWNNLMKRLQKRFGAACPS